MFKICTSCNSGKPNTEYISNDGEFRKTCKKCRSYMSNYMKKYKVDAHKLHKYYVKYYDENKEKVLKRNKLYVQRNREKINRQNRERQAIKRTKKNTSDNYESYIYIKNLFGMQNVGDNNKICSKCLKIKEPEKFQNIDKPNKIYKVCSDCREYCKINRDAKRLEKIENGNLYIY